MIKDKQLLKEKVFYWLLAFVAITISFPAYSISSQAIIGFALFWIFFNSFTEKKELLKKNIIPFLILSIPFWLEIIGLIFSNDFSAASKEITIKIPFLIFPLTLFSVKLHNKTASFITKQFCFGVFAASLLALLKMIYFKVNSLGDYFYYDKLSILLNKHTTYFALFIVLGILFVFHQLLNKKINRIVAVVLLSLFIPMLYMLSVRISVLALLISVLILVFYHLKTKYLILLLIALPLLFGAIYFTPNFQKRFEKSTIENTEIDDIDFRKLHWKAVIETVSQNSLLVGGGTGSNRDYLYDKYKEYKLTAAYEDEYNAHNQFLEILLNNGIIGLFLFLFLLVYLAKNFVYTKDSLAISFFAAFLIFMLTESILERHSGVIVFAFFMSLYLSKSSNKIEVKSIVKNPMITLFFGLLVGILVAFLYKPESNQPKFIEVVEVVKKQKAKVFSDSFENNIQSFWIKEVADITRDSLVKDPTDSTNTVLKITNHLNDYISGGKRAEYLFRPKDSVGQKIKYSFKFLLPESFFKKGELRSSYIIHQWHDEPAPGYNWQTYKRTTEPPINLQVEHNPNGNYVLYFLTGLKTGSMDEVVKIKWPENLVPNKWYTFSCEVLWGLYNNKSYSEPKLDNQYFVNRINPKDSTLTHKIYRRNLYNSIPNYFKFGLYRQGLQKYDRSIYLDDLRLESIETK